ncbi:MAG: transposase, partial [Planctomycetales bacterium]|nr:transposase [Planctomycetales bacterium]
MAGDPCEAPCTGCEFIRGFVQHTLPPRLQKLRYYGFMSPNSAASLDELRWLVLP